MPRAQPGEKTGDIGGFVVVPALIAGVAVIVWMSSGDSMYYGSAKMCYWMLWPLDFINAIHEYRLGIMHDVINPKSASKFFEWTSNAWRLPAAAVGVLALRSGWMAWKHPIGKQTGGLRGKLSVDALMRYQAQIHSPIAPIVAIAKDLHKDTDPRFHTPYHPHEVVEKFGLAKPDGTLDRAAAEAYLVKQLGKRIYMPGISKSDTVFADHLNDWEKVMFALLAPPAIKGKAGLREYHELLDKLNYSAVNATQTPDLRLANEQYQEYRAHPLLNNLWRAHHFSVTYLMQIYKLSKRAGKVTTADVVGWLRPNANSLYAALNSVGRQRTAFAECAGAHEHWEHEQKCQRRNLIPVLPVVVAALKGLEEEYDFWRSSHAGDTVESLWGRMTPEQSRLDTDLFRQHVVDMLTPSMAAPPAPGSDTEFDINEMAARRRYEDEQMSHLMTGMRGTLPEQQRTE